ncbi:MAG: transglycosylase SLT domain-containing protein [Flammeovirgaceae bacterium]|nr:transglycosylase SLT domain-containing protein [Flammeovirgaceae bacterium]
MLNFRINRRLRRASLFIIGLSFLSIPLFSQIYIPDQLNLLGTKIQIEESVKPLIESKVHNLTINPTRFYDLLTRCYLYFPAMERELDFLGVPNDLKYLAVQESTLDGNAVSRSNAVGYWQFKAPTAEEFDLRVDYMVDERKNIISSTRAAGAYIKKSNKYLGNWMYALLSFHSGLTGTKNYLAENRINPNHVVLTKDSHFYLLHFVANYLAFSPQINDTHISRPPLYLLEYVGGTNNTLMEIADFTFSESYRNSPNFQEDLKRWHASIKSINPWLIGARIPDDKYYSVILPIHPTRKYELVGKLNQYAYQGKVRGKKNYFYRDSIKHEYPFIIPMESVGKGYKEVMANGLEAIKVDGKVKLNHIVADWGVSKKDMAKFNDTHLKKNLKPGIYYLEQKPDSLPLSYHIYEKGETLWGISQKYGISLSALKEYNGLSGGLKPEEGDKIWFIPLD